MNIREYISTGILEAYALGELDERERAEVAQMLVQFQELRAELKLIEDTSEQLLMKVAKQPPPGLKSKVLQSIQSRGVQKKVERMTTDNTVQIWRYATAASIILALTSSFMAYNFWDKWKKTELSLNEMITQNQQIAKDYNVVNERLDHIETELRIIDNPAFKRIVMKGTAGAPDALASVYWNETSKEVYLSIQRLKTLAPQQQYQLWAIVDGKPVDMGVFDLPGLPSPRVPGAAAKQGQSGGQTSGLIKMKDVGKAAAFAVTIEPRGGKPTPSLETMQVIGNA